MAHVCMYVQYTCFAYKRGGEYLFKNRYLPTYLYIWFMGKYEEIGMLCKKEEVNIYYYLFDVQCQY